jgi:hypothetical protein
MKKRILPDKELVSKMIRQNEQYKKAEKQVQSKEDKQPQEESNKENTPSDRTSNPTQQQRTRVTANTSTQDNNDPARTQHNPNSLSVLSIFIQFEFYACLQCHIYQSFPKYRKKVTHRYVMLNLP